jgi:ubiquinone/menaquinone biosynthesis C-methylase UbiE
MLNRMRASRNYDLLSFYLDGKILDIGSGNCLIAEKISKTNNITCIDVADNNKSKLPLTVYDGEKIPCEDKLFDTSLLLYVLHHTTNQGELISEAARVTKKRIIVFEDVYTDSFSLFLLKLFDLGNYLSSKKIPMPLNFRKEKEWTNLLKKYGDIEMKKDSDDPSKEANDVYYHT